MSNNQIKSLTIDGITYDIVDETSGFSKVSISRKTTSGINIADITIDGTTTQLYAPQGGGSGTITQVKTTAGAHTAIDVSSGTANFNVPTKTSHLTNDSGFITNIKTINNNSLLGSGNINTPTTFYGTCSTSASTAAKVVNCSEFELTKGAIIGILFGVENTADTPTLNINSTGAKNIYKGHEQVSSSNPLLWDAGEVLTFIYTGGTRYEFVSRSTTIDEVARTERSTATNMTNDGTGVISAGDITDGTGNILSSKLDASRFVSQNLIQLDGGSQTLNANDSWTQPYNIISGTNKNVLVVPAGKYIVTATARYSSLASGNQYGVAISYRYTDDSTWNTLKRGRQLIRVSGTVVHAFSGVALVHASKEIAFTVGTYHQAGCKLIDSIVSVFGFAN